MHTCGLRTTPFVRRHSTNHRIELPTGDIHFLSTILARTFVHGRHGISFDVVLLRHRAALLSVQIYLFFFRGHTAFLVNAPNAL